MNTFAPTGQAIVRSHFIDITFLFPFTPYDSNSVTVVTVGLAVLEWIIGSGTVLFIAVLLFEFVVEVYPLVLPRNPVKRFPGFKNVSSDRFDDEPTEETTALDTRTGRLTRFTTELALQSDPEQPRRLIIPSVPMFLAKKALLRVGPALPFGIWYCVGPLKRLMLFELL